MTGQLAQLLDEFVGRWARDEPLAVDELLVRAGPEADELAGLIDRFSTRRAAVLATYERLLGEA